MFKKSILSIAALTVLAVGHAQSSSNCNCDYTVNSWHWRLDGSDIGNMPNITIHDSVVASNHPANSIGMNPPLSLQGGDVVCVDASVPYSFLRWENISGDPNNPIIIKNVGGQVEIENLTDANQQVVASYGWVFRKSDNFKILGNGDPSVKYGFKVTTHLNSYIQMIDKTTDFEIAYVEVAGDYAGGTHATLSGFAGIMAKSQPICWDHQGGGSTDSSNFELKNVSIHDNYIHDVGGEGMYIGYGKSQGVLLAGCSDTNYPHNVRNLSVFNNIIENVGWDGIQIKNAHYNTQVYNNVIKNYGTKLNGSHDEGLFVGDGSEAIIYGNWIENGTKNSNGMQINAFGNTEIYNNVVLSPGAYGLYLNNQSPQFANRDGKFKIYNNTIEGGSNKFALAAYTPQEVTVKNNILFGFKDDPLYADGLKTLPNTSIVSSNIVVSDVSNVGFEDYSSGDIRLAVGSTAIDAGEDDPYFDQHDYTGALRSDGYVDLGAIENGVAVDSSDLNITITSPSSNSITVTPGQDVLIMASLVDENNKVRSVQYILNDVVVGAGLMPTETDFLIESQHLLPGVNLFKIRVELYGGSTFFSRIIAIMTPSQVALGMNSTAENSQDMKLRISCDSQNGELHITKLNEGLQIEKIEMYSLKGERVAYWRQLDENSPTIIQKIDKLGFGVYLVKVKTNVGHFSERVLLSSDGGI